MLDCSEIMKRTIVITGAAGYVGEMLCEQFAAREDVRRIIAVDKAAETGTLQKLSKVVYLQANLAAEGWQSQVAQYEPEVVVHAAWQIREMYGRAEEQWRWNIGGSDNVFDFSLHYPSVKTLIFFSTAAVYSARASNSLEHLFAEDESPREDAYSYSREKRVSEEHLREKYMAQERAGAHVPAVVVLRPSAITGPRGRFQRIRFGLQSALQGNLKKSVLDRFVTALTALMPAPPRMVRQFIHEDDVTDIVAHWSFADHGPIYETFNITPNDYLTGRDIARVVNKRVLPLWPWMVRFAFGFFWYVTRGKIATAPGSWRFYCYPLLLDGRKITKFGYHYQYSSAEAFTYTDGRYETYVPEAARRRKTSV